MPSKMRIEWLPNEQNALKQLKGRQEAQIKQNKFISKQNSASWLQPQIPAKRMCLANKIA